MGTIADAERLWLETLQQVAGRAAHELKGALNGVSVNVEVVRGRALHPELPASAVGGFAASAAMQLDVVIEMNEALLALARRPRDPVDVAGTLRQFAALLAAGARTAGTPVTVEAAAEGLSAATAVPGIVVRTVVGHLLLALVAGGGGAVRMHPVDGGFAIDAVASKAALEVAPPVAALAAAHGIELGVDGLTLTLTFPSAATVLAR